MENVEKEIMLDNYPPPISIKGTEIILEQMKKYICKIFIKDGGKGTGFFCYINYENISLPVMITNNHVINRHYFENNSVLKVTFYNDFEDKTITLNDKRIIYTNVDYDTTIIQIRPEKDGIQHFLEIDENIFREESNLLYTKQSIYIIQYPKGDAGVSYGMIQYIDNYDITHLCCTDNGSSGSPILNISNNKIIGLHKEGVHGIYKINKGTFLKFPINDFIDKYLKDKSIKNNEVKILLNIEKEDINKNIYFLDNVDYTQYQSNIKHFHDNLKELNDFNVYLYINNNRIKFQKYFVPQKEGKYLINVKFKNLIKDCSFMFANCKNIIKIDLSTFNTGETINMSYMFSGCDNLVELNLLNFNTKMVQTMEGMFGDFTCVSSFFIDFIDFQKIPKEHVIYFRGCKNLKSLDLSSFDTRNVTNMYTMFGNCKSLKALDLSSFNTKNVTNMAGMFGNCESIVDINLSSFNTENVTNMYGIFAECHHLKQLDLSKFNTKKVTIMNSMFHNCRSLINLDLSSFNTQNVTEMLGMFGFCTNLSNINVLSFNTKKVTNMMCLFCSCKSLKSLDVSSFEVEKNADTRGIFCECNNLKELAINSKFFYKIQFEINLNIHFIFKDKNKDEWNIMNAIKLMNKLNNANPQEQKNILNNLQNQNKICLFNFNLNNQIQNNKKDKMEDMINKKPNENQLPKKEFLDDFTKILLENRNKQLKNFNMIHLEKEEQKDKDKFNELIKQFRKEFQLSPVDYSDEKIKNALIKMNYDFSDAFNDLMSFID